MRSNMVPGAVFPDYELSDHTAKRRKLSELQGRDPMVVVLSRGSFCPKDRRQAEGLVELHREMEVGYCRLVTISTDDLAETNEYRMGVGAHWPFLSDARRIVQKDLDIAEYTDAVHNPISYIQYSRPGPADQRGVDFDAVGHLAVSAFDKIGVPHEGQFYLCGPPAFLRELTAGLATWGVPADHVHTEIFGTLDSITPGMKAETHSPHLPAGPAGFGPQVSFARSGVTLPWDARYGSLLELAEACDVPVRWSCRTGVCHTCETALIAGDVDYDPEPLDPPAQGDALICCSRPRGEVVLDL